MMPETGAVRPPPFSIFCSTMQFQAPQAGHFPVHFGLSLPHSVQKYVTVFFICITCLFVFQIAAADDNGQFCLVLRLRQQHCLLRITEKAALHQNRWAINVGHDINIRADLFGVFFVACIDRAIEQCLNRGGTLLTACCFGKKYLCTMD